MDSGLIALTVSIGANGVIALVVFSLKSSLRVAILEAVGKIAEVHATKRELEAAEDRLREQIALRREIRDGFAGLGVFSRKGDT
jgi:hypothetical protein